MLHQLRSWGYKRLTRGIQNKETREVWLERTLAGIPKGQRILDAGAGELQYQKYCTHLNYVSQDFDQYDGKGNQIGLQTETRDQSKLDIVSDITQIPEPDASFDAIMCIEVLEHVPAPVDALRELTRLLKPDGQLIVTAPFCALTHYAPYFYQTGYSRYFYEYWLEHLGLEITDLQLNGNYFDYLTQELQRLPGMAKQYAGSRFTPLEKLSWVVLLSALSRFSSHNAGSEQLLTFGVQVVARKRTKLVSEHTDQPVA